MKTFPSTEDLDEEFDSWPESENPFTLSASYLPQQKNKKGPIISSRFHNEKSGQVFTLPIYK